MKKIFALILVCLCASCFLACGQPSAKTDVTLPANDTQEQQRSVEQDAPQQEFPQDVQNDIRHDVRRNIEIRIDGNYLEGFFEKRMHRSALPGAKRHIDINGNYSVEYIHSPSELPQDSTLDYNLKLNNDHTFTLDVVSEGIQSQHNGHWYVKRGEVMMFYDEKTDPTAHNIRISDNLYGEMLNGGKILLYDNCRIIVLTKTADAPEQSEQ